MGEPDPALLHRFDGSRQHRDLLTDTDPLGRGVGTHLAVVPDPINGRVRSVHVGFGGGGELCRCLREFQLESITFVPQLYQLGAHHLSGAANLVARAKRADRHNNLTNLRPGQHNSPFPPTTPATVASQLTILSSPQSSRDYRRCAT